MRRSQFSLKTLLWLMAVVAAFFGGMAWQKRLDAPVYIWKPLRPDATGKQMTADEARCALRSAGWSVGDKLVETPEGHMWHVYARRGIHKIVAKDESRTES
jgi:hypothetical protein